MNGEYYQYCYMKSDDTPCMRLNYEKSITAGTCTDPGCPEGMVFAPVSNVSRGCVDEKLGLNGLACYYNSNYPPNICYYDGQMCGSYCDYSGQNCKQVYLPQCAKDGYCPQTGFDMSEGCECEGAVTVSNGKNYCCPAGHSYINGGCTMINCGDKYVGEGGICVDSCPEYISDGVCVPECPSGQIPDEKGICA